MFSNLPDDNLHNVGETGAALLQGEPGAAIAIDVHAGAVVAANANAMQGLSLKADTKFPYALDSAMPALARLRQISTCQTANGAEPFTFWIEGRKFPLLCSPKFSIINGRPLAVMSWHDQKTDAQVLDRPAAIAKLSAAIGDGDVRNAPSNDPAGLIGAVDPPPVRSAPARSDADTLKAIARAIREGRPIRQSLPELRSTEQTDLHDPELQDPEQPTIPAVQPTKKGPLSTIPDVPADIAAQTIPSSTFDRQNLAELAHELQTPLGAIVAAAEIMRDQRLGPMGNEKYLSYASDVHDSANHAMAVISRLLDAGRNSAEVQEPAFAPVDLNAVAARVVSSMMPLAKSRGLTLEIEAERDLAHVLADETAIRQIVLNLLTNALKFTPRDGDVRVVTGYLNDGGVFLVVRDTGIGMTQAAIEAALTGGVTSVTTGPRLGGGLGLGLPLVRGLISANQAKLEIDSAPNKGTVALVAFDKHRVVLR